MGHPGSHIRRSSAVKRASFFLVGTLIFLTACVVVKNSRAATESPEYKVGKSEGDYEVREYPALKLASTSMPEREMDGSFMRLFRYISGANEGGQQIAMTTPVLIEKKEADTTMSFIMPKDAVLKGVPQPKGENVTLAETKPEKFVTLRFKGARSEDAEKSALASLQKWAAEQKIMVTGAPVFAYYDPPWTPLFMRRNEVMLRVKE
jgi:hypothetical protein